MIKINPLALAYLPKTIGCPYLNLAMHDSFIETLQLTPPKEWSLKRLSRHINAEGCLCALLLCSELFQIENDPSNAFILKKGQVINLLLGYSVYMRSATAKIAGCGPLRALCDTLHKGESCKTAQTQTEHYRELQHALMNYLKALSNEGTLGALITFIDVVVEANQRQKDIVFPRTACYGWGEMRKIYEHCENVVRLGNAQSGGEGNTAAMIAGLERAQRESASGVPTQGNHWTTPQQTPFSHPHLAYPPVPSKTPLDLYGNQPARHSAEEASVSAEQIVGSWQTDLFKMSSAVTGCPLPAPLPCYSQPYGRTAASATHPAQAFWNQLSAPVSGALPQAETPPSTQWTTVDLIQRIEKLESVVVKMHQTVCDLMRSLNAVGAESVKAPVEKAIKPKRVFVKQNTQPTQS